MRACLFPLALMAALLLPAGVPVFSLDWPVANKIITGTFCEDRGDHFHGGIDIGGGEQEVRAVLEGELVFRYEEGSDYSTLPRGVGTFVVLHHAQDILSLYCHMASGSLGAVRTRYAQQERIGVEGDTGHADGKHLHFAVYDQENGSIVNPLALLPPLADGQAPVIRRVMLVRTEGAGQPQNAAAHPEGPARPASPPGAVLQLADTAVVPAGSFEVLAEAYDLREDVRFAWTLAPYRISVTLDGKETTRIAFDSLQCVEGRIVVGTSKLSRSDLYTADGLVRCGSLQLSPGDSRLLLSVSDFAGNTSTRQIALTVRE